MTEYITAEHILSNLANLPQLVFEVTDACNLKCKYCAYGDFYEDFDKRENKSLPISKAIMLLDFLNHYWNSGRNTSAKGFMYISFYGGEPLLNFKFISNIVEYIERKINSPHRKFLFSMTTNAILLHEYMDYIVEHNFHILVSLDGNEWNDSYRVDHRGEGSFERVVSNVDLLRERYPDFFNKNVSFNSVLHNRSTVEEVCRFFKDKYNKNPTISELNSSGIRADKKEEFNRIYRNTEQSLQQSEHYEEIEDELFMGASSYKSLALYLHQYSGNYYRDYTDLLFDKKSIHYIPTGTCIPFSKKMFVTVNGKILPCERIGHKFCLGHITDSQVYLNPTVIAQKYNEYYNRMEKQCHNCKNRPSCIQCLFNLENIDNNPKCHGFMDAKMFNNFQQRQLQFLGRHPDAYRKIMQETMTL